MWYGINSSGTLFTTNKGVNSENMSMRFSGTWMGGFSHSHTDTIAYSRFLAKCSSSCVFPYLSNSALVLWFPLQGHPYHLNPLNCYIV